MNRQNLSFTVVGVLGGAIFMFAVQGRQLDRLSLQLSNYSMEVQDLQQQNEQLTEKLHQPSQEAIVQSIRVDAQAPDGLSEIEAIQFVKQQLAFLIGRPLRTLVVHPDLPYRLLEGRILNVDQQKFMLHVNTVVVGETLYINVSTATEKPS